MNKAEKLNKQQDNGVLPCVNNHNFDITIEKKYKNEFLATDYVIKKIDGEVIYEGNLDECRGFMRGFYYSC
jgi:hypothetical protein